MTLKSNRGVTWTETVPATLQFGDPIETDKLSEITKDIKIVLNLIEKLKRYETKLAHVRL